MDKDMVNRWRLILGRYSKESLGVQLDTELTEIDNAMDFIYNREYTKEMGVRESGERIMHVPEWLTKIRELFPKNVVEVIEKHALEKYNMQELLNDKEVLEKLEPNKTLLKTILQMKDMMNKEVLHEAKKIVKKVADEIKKEIQTDIKQAIVGKLDKSNMGHLKNKNNINIKKTIMSNLKNYNKELDQLIVERVIYNSRIKNYNKWNVIIAVDESGSMLDSVIHSAIMAGIFAELPMLKTNLIIFDTEVVDLTDYIDDPVSTMMSVQLGGGTHIYKALNYSNTLITNPLKTIVVLISDLYENGSYNSMYSYANDIIESGAKLIVLTSLDKDCVGVYDKNAANMLRNMGAEVAALTPEGLSKWIAKIIN